MQFNDFLDKLLLCLKVRFKLLFVSVLKVLLKSPFNLAAQLKEIKDRDLIWGLNLLIKSRQLLEYLFELIILGGIGVNL